MRFLVYLSVLFIGINLIEPAHELSSAFNGFTLDVLKQTVKGQKQSINTILSPFSLGKVLAMVMYGARGKTSHQIMSTLKLESLGDKKLHEKISEVYGQLNPPRTVTYKVANGIYPDVTFPIDMQFKNDLINMYDTADIQNLDFTNSLGAEEAINKNVANATNNAIRKIFIKKTRLVLTNAAYFKGNWNYSESNLNLQRKSESFYKDDGKNVKIPTISITDTLASYKSNVTIASGQTVDILQLDYSPPTTYSSKIDDVKLYIILPAKRGLSSLIANLTVSDLDELTQRLPEEIINISIPTFKISYRAEMKKILQKLGMKDIFDRQKADLSDMVNRTSGKDGKRLYVDQFYHKSFIHIDEKEITANLLGYGISNRDGKNLKIDRPFLFYIVSYPLNTILFIGTFGGF